MRFVDLFCGIGGSAYGAMQLGLEPHLLVDSDPICLDVLGRELSGKFVCADLTRLDDSLFDSMSGAEVLLGSPPCQNYSGLKTKNKGSSLTRVDHDFIDSILKTCEMVSPRAVVVENVASFLKSKTCARLVTGLMKQGFSITASVIDALEMGVPQRRKRTIVTASRKFHKLKALSGDLTVLDAFNGLPILNTTDPLHQSRKRHSPDVMKKISMIPKNGGSRSSLPDDMQLACHFRSDGFRDVYGRMSWSLPAPTITSGCTNPSKGRFLHPEENRAITLREAARLQTLPDTVLLKKTRSGEAKAKLIGNAFPPQFIENVLKQILS